MSYIPPKAEPKTSTLNSTTIPLNAGQTYVGTWEDCLAFQDISIAVMTDQDGIYTIQFSPDGINVDSSLTRYYRVNQIDPPHIFEVTRQYYRISFQNTSLTNQTFLRLQTILSDRGQLNIPIDATMSQDYDSISTRPTKYEYEVALGRRQGATTWNKFGYNIDLDIETEVIAAFGGIFTPLTTASTLTIVSSSIDDTNGGTGARTVTIVGVDADHVLQTEIVTLNGTTPIVTTTTWLGINTASVSLSGAISSNVGLITITATTGGVIQATIPAGEGNTQQAIFFTQKSHKFLADFLSLNAGKIGRGASPKITITGWAYSYVTNTKYLIFKKLLDTTAENSVTLTPPQPFVVDEKSCLYFEATSNQADSSVSCRFSGIEFKNVNA